MRTIFVTALTGLEIRNFLVSDFYRFLQEKQDMRVVFFVEAVKYEFCKNKFSQKNQTIEPVPDIQTAQKPLRRFLNLICYASIATPTIQFRQKRAYLNGGSMINYLFKHFIWILGHFKIWKLLLRSFEYYILHDDQIWKKYFERYRPAVVMGTSLTLDEDTALLKYAKRRRIPTVGMVRSWDNLTSKTFLRIHPDRLLVQNPHMVEEATKLGDYPRERIRIVGFPQFEKYFDSAWHMSREELAARFNLDPGKRWITYFTGGLPLSVLNKRDYTDHVLMLKRSCERGEFGNAQILVRVHPNDNIILQGEAAKIPILDFGKDFKFGWDDVKLLLNVLRLSDVTINLGSTIALEAAIFNRPIILAAFNGYDEDKLPWQNKLSVTLANTVHYKDVEETGGVWKVRNEKELIQAVKTYLENPKLHEEGRRRLVETLVGPIGGASQRIFDTVISLIK
ncbi:MAG: CDP-glycerol glycerophosphotransferase family protein [Candidatus Sungiibacteriota bacterium]|uniref:CDP-glycerol glycerophosphotransferase family protein n=1 Tax=Candidatus Sungiibacteriota bacterium TaxID=2750080 RepID=A0A7T5RJV8_9BACT|nr:MAG: CDP-glycerol glycerophosphotransferase family protein [Candidatus Sungbacteria bacterium]